MLDNSFQVYLYVSSKKRKKNVISFFQISSGMMRAVIQRVDVYTMLEDSIYLIDEIENSMGIRKGCGNRNDLSR
jgi:hypothetical protein